MITLAVESNYATLFAHPLWVSFARNHIRRTLTRWGHAYLIDSAELIGSEFVTNAIRATIDAGPPTDDEIAQYGRFTAFARHVLIGLHIPGDALILEVWDRSHIPPKLGEYTPDEIGGRSLQLVDVLAAQWGYRWLKSGGKIVWAAIDVAGPDD